MIGKRHGEWEECHVEYNRVVEFIVCDSIRQRTVTLSPPMWQYLTSTSALLALSPPTLPTPTRLHHVVPRWNILALRARGQGDWYGAGDCKGEGATDLWLWAERGQITIRPLKDTAIRVSATLCHSDAAFNGTAPWRKNIMSVWRLPIAWTYGEKW